MVVPETMKTVVTDLRNVQSQISDVQQEIVKTGSVDEADKVYKDYNSNDGMTNQNLYNGYASFLLAFHRYNSSKTITFSLVKVEDDTATLSITL
jgi:hypothetical protein